MAYLSFTQFPSLPRWQSRWTLFPNVKSLELNHIGLKDRWHLTAVSKRKFTEALAQEVSEEGDVVEKKTRQTSKRATSRIRRKAATENPENGSVSVMGGNLIHEETKTASDLIEKSKKTRRRARKKDALATDTPEEEEANKKVTRRRRTKKQVNDTVDQGSVTEFSDQDGDIFLADEDSDQGTELEIDEGEDISFTYGWPPLVCCFGAAQHAFIPAGRRANRLIDHDMHERRKDAIWEPEKFVRSPGGCSSNVAVALACLGGKVASMGKLGDDDYGQSLLYFLNINKVQTRSIRIDSKRITAVSRMKIGKRGGLRMTTVKSCAEDSLLKSEINIDVLKESADETKTFIQKAWALADVIEVTKQELEFLCGIEAFEEFDTKNNDRSKFAYYAPEVVAPLWHENLKVLFVTNGTSKIHYYTKEHNGFVLGMEDAPLTPYTSDMSASGDGIVAGIMRMLTVQPHLITDKGYLERTIKYAISCGVIDQWLQARQRGYPAKECMEEDVIPDSRGIRSITEKEYRTLVPAG